MDTMNDSTAPASSSQTDQITIRAIDATEVPLASESGPHGYRLAKKPDGELVLQGAFVRTRGFAERTTIWRDQETVAWEPAK
jgi:hypothetical protein